MRYDEDYETFLARVLEFLKPQPETQIIKLMEEVGEVAEAWIGVTGTNPRKGHIHTEHDVANEFADVIITALLGIMTLGFDPMTVLTEQQEKTEDRLRAAMVVGSRHGDHRVREAEPARQQEVHGSQQAGQGNPNGELPEADSVA